jgi:hypothetical protein
MRQEQTSNQCLWEQLAETERREQVAKRELQQAQQSLAAYEKLMEKMQA